MKVTWSICFLAIAIRATLPTASAEEDEGGLVGTCQGFLQATQILRQLNDPVALNSYREMSERSYESINKIALDRKMKPLPISTGPQGYANRLSMLESICLKTPSLLFREAVTANYMMMRQAAGLSNELPK